MKSLKSKNIVATAFDDEAGNLYQEAYFNGYWFGDRLLEGVYFKAVLDKDGYLIVSCTQENEKYFSKLNTKYWLEIALRFAEQNDIFSQNSDGSGEELCYVVSP